MKHTFIKNFGSGEYEEPPACYVDVYADQKPDTAEILHYKVPVLGPKWDIDIFINLSLRPRTATNENHFVFKLNFAHKSAEHKPPSESDKTICASQNYMKTLIFDFIVMSIYFSCR